MGRGRAADQSLEQAYIEYLPSILSSTVALMDMMCFDRKDQIDASDRLVKMFGKPTVVERERVERAAKHILSSDLGDVFPEEGSAQNGVPCSSPTGQACVIAPNAALPCDRDTVACSMDDLFPQV